MVKIGLKRELVPVFLLLHLTKKFRCAVCLYALPFPTFIFVISWHRTLGRSQRASCSTSCVLASNQYRGFFNLANPLLLSWVFFFLMVVHIVTRCYELGQKKQWARCSHDTGAVLEVSRHGPWWLSPGLGISAPWIAVNKPNCVCEGPSALTPSAPCSSLCQQLTALVSSLGVSSLPPPWGWTHM